LQDYNIRLRKVRMYSRRHCANHNVVSGEKGILERLHKRLQEASQPLRGGRGISRTRVLMIEVQTRIDCHNQMLYFRFSSKTKSSSDQFKRESRVVEAMRFKQNDVEKKPWILSSVHQIHNSITMHCICHQMSRQGHSSAPKLLSHVKNFWNSSRKVIVL
jgi:hypothetical protein